MKKIVVACGLLAGLFVSTVMVVSIAISYQRGTFEGNVLIGYGSMLLAFSLVFVGIKNYRDKYNNGVMSFGKAFKTGLFITLIASTMYVLVWAVAYNFFMNDFLDLYTAETLKAMKSTGIRQVEYDKQVIEMNNMKQDYKSPLYFVLFTYLEILPVGLIVTLISALILKRKNKQQLQGAF